MDADEPLDEWAKRREERKRPIGELKAVILGHEHAAAHLHPRAPRVILRWDGYQWSPYRMADGYAAAQRVLHGTDDGQAAVLPTGPSGQPMAPGTGRHRKP
ncbi:hypothetical protein GT045_22770 [Streptomyces sp. SID486]|uniref:DUF6087 family protein n=1 Tax=unclassified Streptomyces TaxID=2593676 RepID=UPI00136997A1|nr:hypothetical protein [Streptomyces sp. SID2955]MYW45956.1 hypothetical protein [Streptomyces sp. SID161]MYX97560.1 hypothetical protein [Streptomyces sp. SID486]